MPGGDDWHRRLLEQMSLDIPHVRPALLASDLRMHLDALSRFRHRVRHAHDQDYEWSRMTEPLRARAEVAARLPAFFAETNAAISEIVRALEGAAGNRTD